MHRVMLTGRMAGDPDVGDKVTRFRVADDVYNATTQSREAIFIPCKVFGKQKEVVDKYLGKGDRVAVEGRLDIRDNGKQGDDRRVYTDIIAERVELLESKQTSSRSSGPADDSPAGW